ncbi:dipeptidase PepE [Mesonia ostreae]|uniref:Dipeptidase PepE n=1 Tax=Mesonia ostreae TaxID=861110 RepID=A0ABU2KEU9_9FLAO|nr:dipeptidase PepE [Mesonia ostreae]MDT0293220.1 dipeptidase PepE [Mesonia ostreae]
MNCIIASTSTVHGSSYLGYFHDALTELFTGVKEIIFIPYARPGGISHKEYTKKAQEGLKFLNIDVVGLHEKENPKQAIENAQAIFTGGGNTFLLVSQLYKNDLMNNLSDKIKAGCAYLGTSAGSNICGKTMHTTNDMPIVHPPLFDTLGLFPFNINPHYLDPDPNSTHKGETRETRIKEFQQQHKIPVVGLREGSWIRIKDQDLVLKGDLNARVFIPQKEAIEVKPNHSFKNLS